ncbi:molybdopterin-guanine dinucleotide biosynthesis protein B [Desulforhopalus singaporensis]|uniref:Molybdopterin-guanine dinucleotide biosynthesis protein B n=1 Tax=Desulforhopalus singaporensis TaxID=91360 RepID=A0A1H0M5J3_9BACT|nr:molybdopterin-guanine dinucleotide biosynthesis protein B [Desulforhopalus singaporensis]SDO75635.1 molybdopterin-guanine dinucleotide biosynthesis protein B [Desulforhopalus singaporensis]
MPAIVSFIGWHDSGKTTLASRVVAEVKRLGYNVAVIKSSSEKGIVFDSPGTDTYKHTKAGADGIMLVAPDQMIVRTGNKGLDLATLANRFFPEVDLVVGEGFKTADSIAKIEVFKDSDMRIREQVDGVVAIAASHRVVSHLPVFSLDDAREIAQFILDRFFEGKKTTTCVVLVNDRPISLVGKDSEKITRLVADFISERAGGDTIESIDIHIDLK